MLKLSAVALGLMVAVGTASTAANATDYRYGGYGRDRYESRHYDWRRDHRPHYLSDAYRFERWRAWREHRDNRRYARWWRRDY